MSNYIIQTLTQKLPQRILAKFGFGKNLSAVALRKQSTKLGCVNELILAKFEACLLGALVGDCIGKKFEGFWGPNLAEIIDEYRILRDKVEAQENGGGYLESNHVTVSLFETYLSRRWSTGSGDVQNADVGDESNKRAYTDDTALTRALCDSFIKCSGEFSVSHVAAEFELAYACDPNRGYSSGSIVLFKKLNKLKQAGELDRKCLQPAMELFNGEGSYGNGGGMRCSAIALFCYGKSLDEMRLVCEISTRVTHAHKWAIIGALQHCYALRLALDAIVSSPSKFDFDAFYHSIVAFVYDLERTFDSLDQINAQPQRLDACAKSTRDSYMLYLEQKNELNQMRKKQMTKSHHHHHHHHHHHNHHHNQSHQKNIAQCQTNDQRHQHHHLHMHAYSNLLRKLKRLVKRCRSGGVLNTVRFYQQMSRYGVSALETIPVALLAFMVACDVRCRNELSLKLNSSDPFTEFSAIERVLFYSVALGGETNKIASMSAALAGAAFGSSTSSSDQSPYRTSNRNLLVDMCEGAADARAYANKLFELVSASINAELPPQQNNQYNSAAIVMDDAASIKLNYQAVTS